MTEFRTSKELLESPKASKQLPHSFFAAADAVGKG